MQDIKQTEESQFVILLVEDIPDHARLMEIKLKASNSGYEVKMVNSGAACLALLDQEQFDLIILDYVLPGMSGLETLKKIKFQYPELPVIIVTGQGDERLAVQALKHGASDYLVKEKGYEKFLPQVVKQFIEKRQLEQMLIHSELRYQSLFEQANDAIFIEETSQGELLDINLKATELTGYSKVDLLNMTFADLITTESRQVLNAGSSTTQPHSGSKYHNLYLKRKDGQLEPVDISTSLINLGHFQVKQNIVRDTREKRRLENLILESKKRLQALFDGITDFITVQNRDFNIIMANRKIASRCKTVPENLIGKKCYQVYFGRKTACEDCPLLKTFEKGEPHFSELILQDDIHHLWSFPMHGLNNRLEYVIIHGKIVTEQKRLEKQFIQSEKMATIGILASGVAHELRNPLNVIEAARYAIESEIDQSKAGIIRKLGTIKKHVQRASNIIHNLLEFSKPASANKNQVDIIALLNSTIALVEKKMEIKRIKLIQEYEKLPLIAFDLDSLKQAFLNIIINAIQAMPKGGELRVKAFLPSAEKVQISFRDTGVGIEPEHIKHIFTPFFTTKGSSKGTGLGMYICHSIIQRNGGEVYLESKKGVGTTAHVVLPVSCSKKGV